MTTLRWLWIVWLTAFALLMSGPAIASEVYTLGVGDRVSMTVYGQEDLETRAEVAADGTIAVPLIGRVNVQGLTPPAAANLISMRLEQGGYLKTAHVNLLVEEYRSNTISVLGHVNKPGRIAMVGPTTLTDAVALAGGISPDGGERIILVRTDAEGRQTRQEYYLRELLDSEAGKSSVISIEKGDTLYVPRAEQFYVHGQVQKPGTYPLDRPLNVMQALSVSGGLNQSASTRGLVLYRQKPDGSVSKYKVELTDAIKDGDVLFVEESMF